MNARTNCWLHPIPIPADVKKTVHQDIVQNKPEGCATALRQPMRLQRFISCDACKNKLLVASSSNPHRCQRRLTIKALCKTRQKAVCRTNTGSKSWVTSQVGLCPLLGACLWHTLTSKLSLVVLSMSASWHNLRHTFAYKFSLVALSMTCQLLGTCWWHTLPSNMHSACTVGSLLQICDTHCQQFQPCCIRHALSLWQTLTSFLKIALSTNCQRQSMLHRYILPAFWKLHSAQTVRFRTCCKESCTQHKLLASEHAANQDTMPCKLKTRDRRVSMHMSAEGTCKRFTHDICWNMCIVSTL